MTNIFTLPFLLSVIYAGIRMSVPITFATTGEIISERSGVLNISLEGQMLFGAFFSFTVAYFTGSNILGIIAGAFGGLALALILAVACVSFQADQSIAGITLNMFAAGFTTFFYRIIFGISTDPPSVKSIPSLSIPGLSTHKILGPLLFNNNYLVYVSLVVMIIAHMIIFNTTAGLKLRSVGENPLAAETMGVNVVKTRYLAILFCGILAGVGGSYLSLSILGRFVTDATAGRGYIALAITIFSGWKPIKGFFAAILFGMLQGLQMRLQALGVSVPYQFMMMIPYFFTLVVLIFSRGKRKPPQSLTLPYVRGEL